MTLRAVAYARVSSAAQRERDTIASQLRVLPEYIARMGWTLVAPIDTYVDDGRSAKAGKLELRDGLARLLADAARGLFDVVVVVDIDRLTRSEDLAERGAILGALQRAGVQIASAMSGELVDLSTSHGDLLATLKAYFAAEDNRKRAERARQGRIEALRRGRKGAGGALYGLRYDRHAADAEAWSLHPEQAPIVLEIFERVAAGESCHAIGMDLDARAIPRPRGRWSRNRVWEIVRSRYPIGEWLADRRSHLIVHVPQLVTPELWQRAQTAMRTVRKRGLDRSKHVYLLNGIATCGLCGGRIKIRWQRDNTVAMYLCDNRLNRWRGAPACPFVAQKTHEVDARVWGRVLDAVMDPSLPERLAARRRNHADERRDWQADVQAAERHLARLDNVEGALLARFRRGTIGEGRLDTELATIARERDAVRLQADAARRAQDALGARDAETQPLTDLVSKLRVATKSETLALRRAALAALVVPGSVVFRDEHVDLELDLPLLAGEPVLSYPVDVASPVHESTIRLRVVA